MWVGEVNVLLFKFIIQITLEWSIVVESTLRVENEAADVEFNTRKNECASWQIYTIEINYISFFVQSVISRK